jgi:hypothetical protein
MTPDRETCCGVMSPARFPDHKLELESMTNSWVLFALWVVLALDAGFHFRARTQAGSLPGHGD